MQPICKNTEKIRKGGVLVVGILRDSSKVFGEEVDLSLPYVAENREHIKAL